MICNFKKCRKALTSTAWVTSCSHAFCEDHGESEFAKNPYDALQCPACNTPLPGKFDVVQADLNPPESFKSIVLAGMKPDVIMDIAMRAISFWSYQTSEEARYQETVARHALEQAKGLEDFYSLNMQKFDAELKGSRQKIDVLRNECNNQKKRAEEYAAKVEEKNRKIQMLQHELDCRRRKSFHVNDAKDREKSKKTMVDMIGNKHQAASKFIFQPNLQKNFEKKSPECAVNREDIPQPKCDDRFSFLSSMPSGNT